jgi:hypothetical protein
VNKNRRNIYHRQTFQNVTNIWSVFNICFVVYPNSLDCIWTIKSSPGHRIQFTVDPHTFDLEDGGSGNSSSPYVLSITNIIQLSIILDVQVIIWNFAMAVVDMQH